MVRRRTFNKSTRAFGLSSITPLVGLFFPEITAGSRLVSTNNADNACPLNVRISPFLNTVTTNIRMLLQLVTVKVRFKVSPTVLCIVPVPPMALIDTRLRTPTVL